MDSGRRKRLALCIWAVISIIIPALIWTQIWHWYVFPDTFWNFCAVWFAVTCVGWYYTWYLASKNLLGD